ncbi:MAG: HPF/RaiA family ribosome-associated protein, partial [Paludibacteraceae bacterium]|nr:HPF/RaiA family ribosome-associated protein [Paludibacteraceae bacterium]
MDIKIQPIHFKVTERLEEHINKKVSKLEKLNDQ